MLETVASLFSDVGLWLSVWVAALIGFSAFILRSSNTPQKPRLWVVRRGECPFCGYALFGTTPEYRRLYIPEHLTPKSQYLCVSCDREKVVDFLSKFRLGLTDD